MVNLLPDAALVLDKDQKILIMNNRFLQQFNFKEQEITTLSFMELAHNKWKTDKLNDMFLHGTADEVFMQHDFPGLGTIGLLIKSVPIVTGDEEVSLTLVTLKNTKSE